MITFMWKGEDVELLDPIDCVAYCGVTEHTLSRWRRRKWGGGDGVIQFGRGFVYTKVALDRAMELQGHDRRWTNVTLEVQ